jgi:fructokinase
MADYKIGVDLGGTKTEVVLITDEGEELFRKRQPTPKHEGYDAILHSIVGIINEAKSQIPEKSKLPSLGMGIPGIIDSESGLVINANTTILIGHPLGEDLKKHLGQPIDIENDANCFAMAEAVAGAAKGYNFVFGVIMGTGCGGGLFHDGHIRNGPHGITGEWGHFSIDPDGLDCYCGNTGCIETLISGSGVERHYEKKFGEKKAMQEIVELYRNGDPKAGDIFSKFIDDFGRAVGGLISVLDPDAVVLGGGLSNIDELYTDGLDAVRKYAFHKNLRTPILKNQLGDSAGVLGAAWTGI